MNCQRSTSVSSVPHPRFTFIPSLTFCGINSVQSVDRLHSPASAMSVSDKSLRVSSVSRYQPPARDFVIAFSSVSFLAREFIFYFLWLCRDSFLHD